MLQDASGGVCFVGRLTRSDWADDNHRMCIYTCVYLEILAGDGHNILHQCGLARTTITTVVPFGYLSCDDYDYDDDDDHD